MFRFRKAHFEHGKVWAIAEPALRSLLQSAAAQETSVDAIARQWGESMEGTYSAEIVDGVAVIPVAGPLMRQLSFWSWFFGGSAYELLAKEIGTAISNPAVRAVVLDIDSPGGEVTGCGELAELIFRMRGEKPLIAYATGTCASAAYWIASACDEFFCSPTSAVGSIGCVASIRDYRLAEEKFGIREFEFVSSVSPAKRSDPATDEGAARIQAQVDALGAVFVEAVAKNRAVSNADVIAGFGKGDVFVGAAAVEAGLADGIATLEDVIAEFGNQAAVEAAANGETDMLVRGAKALTKAVKSKATTKASAKISAKAKARAEDDDDKEEDLEDEQDDTVAEGDEDQDESADDDDDDVDAEEDDTDESAEDDEDKDETADDEDEDKPVSKAKASGERGRIAAILESPHAKGRSRLARHLALNTGMTAKAAIGVLKASPKASATSAKKASNPFDAAMRAQGNPKIGSGSGKTGAVDEGAARITAAAKLIGLA